MATLQHAIAEQLGALVALANADRPLALVGSLFRNSFFTSAIAARWPGEVLVAPDPGAGGMAVGALAAEGHVLEAPSPFAGPSFAATETKTLLDGCKLSYDFVRNPSCD